ALVSIGKLFDSAGQPALIAAVIFAIAAGLLAFGEFTWGGRAARREERRVRARILQQQHALATASTTDGMDNARVVAMATDNTERVTEFRQVYLGATIAAVL